MAEFKLKDASLKLVSSARSWGGYQQVYSHESKETGTTMKFSLYVPPNVAAGVDSTSGDCSVTAPVVYWLSGLTCSEENFIVKSGFQRAAARLGLIVVGPDTSPRGLDLPGEKDSWDFGLAAGFYVNSIQEPWKKNYRMFSYVTQELRELVESNFPITPDQRSIMGHSMGGHGALICSLKNPEMYRTVSAFAPISNPSNGPWGIKAFSGYLGSDKSTWADWDATELVKSYSGPPLQIIVDQGAGDPWLAKGELLPENFIGASKSNDAVSVKYNLREGYDHGYFYISTFIDEHLEHHAAVFNQ